MSTTSPQKRKVFFNEFNVVMGNTSYLPLVSGLLRAFAETSETVRENYEFAPFQFQIDCAETILDRYRDPSVAAFSVAMWNEQLNLHVAREVKRRWPDCLIVFGGPQVPHDPTEYFETHPFIDVTVRGEGEEPFTHVLERYIESRRFDDIPGVSWRDCDTGECQINAEDQPFNRDLDYYPSPYLEGLYEPLMAANPDIDFQAILETNRGCPFLCTFCYWGKGGLSRKYRYHGIDRVAGELEWCAQQKIRYVFNADSNFGMHRRDMDIAKKIVALKKSYGYPEKFRTCYGKNTDEKIFEIGVLFHEHSVEKGITLSRQSNNPETLKHVKRDNIKLEVYTNLQRRFNDYDVPVYCEMIQGLPGETYESWVAGVETLMQTALKNQIYMYHCQIYNNTELADPAYRAEHGLETRTIDLQVIHGSSNQPGWISEREETIVATKSMPIEDWRRMSIFSWTTMLLHSLKTGFFLMGYLNDRFGIPYTEFIRYIAELRMPAKHGSMFRQEVARQNEMLDRILSGQGRGCHDEEFGEIYWELEEICYLHVAQDLGKFYEEFADVVFDFLDDRGVDYEITEVREAVRYQELRIPTPEGDANRTHDFTYNFPEYFATQLGTSPQPLATNSQSLTVTQTSFAGDNREYAREVILWGRKSGLMLTNTEWQALVAPPMISAAE